VSIVGSIGHSDHGENRNVLLHEYYASPTFWSQKSTREQCVRRGRELYIRNRLDVDSAVAIVIRQLAEIFPLIFHTTISEHSYDISFNSVVFARYLDSSRLHLTPKIPMLGSLRNSDVDRHVSSNSGALVFVQSSEPILHMTVQNTLLRSNSGLSTPNQDLKQEICKTWLDKSASSEGFKEVMVSTLDTTLEDPAPSGRL
jgi:hypothetical protein